MRLPGRYSHIAWETPARQSTRRFPGCPLRAEPRKDRRFSSFYLSLLAVNTYRIARSGVVVLHPTCGVQSAIPRYN
jgi:hypothetical protein